MNTPLSRSNLSVSQALRRYPELLPVFMKYHTGCVGCPMASFCSLQAAADIHKLDNTAFLQEIETVIQLAEDSSESGNI